MFSHGLIRIDRNCGGIQGVGANVVDALIISNISGQSVMEFEDKVVLVSGASSGIGRATAIKFAHEGARVIATSRDENRGKLIEKELQEIQSDCLWIGADILDTEEIRKLFSTIDDMGLSLDIAFNNASAGGGADFIHQFDHNDWESTIHGTLTSVFTFMQYELRDMVVAEEGVIINNSSVDGLRGFAYDPAYAAAKHGVLGLTKSTALQYAKTSIRINAICPGWVDTPPVNRLLDSGELDRDVVLGHQPVGRLGQPDEIADAVLWLASDRASFVTGTALPVDGGYTAF